MQGVHHKQEESAHHRMLEALDSLELILMLGDLRRLAMPFDDHLDLQYKGDSVVKGPKHLGRAIGQVNGMRCIPCVKTVLIVQARLWHRQKRQSGRRSCMRSLPGNAHSRAVSEAGCQRMKMQDFIDPSCRSLAYQNCFFCVAWDDANHLQI